MCSLTHTVKHTLHRTPAPPANPPPPPPPQQAMLQEMRLRRGDAPYGHTQQLAVYWPPHMRVSRVGAGARRGVGRRRGAGGAGGRGVGIGGRRELGGGGEIVHTSPPNLTKTN